MQVTKGGQSVTDSLNGKLTFEQDKNRLVGRDEDNLIRLVLLANGSDFIMKISPPGIDATTATNDQLIFNSANNLPKIVETGTFVLDAADFNASGNTYLTYLASETINYPPGVTAPIVWVFYENALGERTQLPYSQFDYDTGDLDYIAQQRISDTSVRVEVRSKNALSPGIPFRYYILQETTAP